MEILYIYELLWFGFPLTKKMVFMESKLKLCKKRRKTNNDPPPPPKKTRKKNIKALKIS